MTVKLGPVTSKYKGTLSIVEADEQAHRAVLKAGARDARGGRASATITSTMEEVSDGTKVVVETDMKITGPAAQFGRGVMQDVSAKLMNQFATCLAAEITREPATAEAGTGTEEAATVSTGAATNGDGAATAARGGAPAGGEVPTPAPGATGTAEAPLTAAASPGSEPPRVPGRRRARRRTCSTSAPRRATRCSSGPSRPPARSSACSCCSWCCAACGDDRRRLTACRRACSFSPSMIDEPLGGAG